MGRPGKSSVTVSRSSRTLLIPNTIPVISSNSFNPTSNTDIFPFVLMNDMSFMRILAVSTIWLIIARLDTSSMAGSTNESKPTALTALQVHTPVGWRVFTSDKELTE